MRYIRLGLILLVLAIIGGGFFIWSKNQPSVVPAKPLSDKNRMLTSEQQKIYSDRIKQAEQYLTTIQPTASGAQLEQSNTYVFIGQQYFGLGQLEKSKQMYNKALSIDSKNEQAFASLSLTLLDAENFTEAGRSYEQIIEINPKSYNAWINLIQIREKEGAGTDDIQSLYEDALKKTENNIDIITKYAQFKEGIGDIQSAIELWQQAMVLYSDGTAVYQAEIDRLMLINNIP